MSAAPLLKRHSTALDRKVPGRNSTRVLPTGNTRDSTGHGYEQCRKAYFAGEGLGIRFLTEYLPGGTEIRDATLSVAIKERYGEKRVEVKNLKAANKKHRHPSNEKSKD
jgi:hypothetical protein